MKLFNTTFDKKDVDSISKVIESGEIGFGDNVALLEDKWREFSKKEHNVATNSASAAAFMVFAYLKDTYGVCDVFTPSLGFTSPAWAAQHHGHNLVWIDVDDQLLFDIQDYKKTLRSLNSTRHRVVMPILYGGVSDIPEFNYTFTETPLGWDTTIVVDSAHCATPTIVSDFIFFSFHPYKPIASSDGGMISTGHSKAVEYFRLYRNFGRKNIKEGYDITTSGFKFYMNNLNATIALTQLYTYRDRLKLRQENYKLLQNNLQDTGRLLAHDKMSSFYFSTLITSSDRYLEIHKKYTTSKHYPPLHKMEFYENTTTTYSLPNTEKLYNQMINIPLYKRIVS